MGGDEVGGHLLDLGRGAPEEGLAVAAAGVVHPIDKALPGQDGCGGDGGVGLSLGALLEHDAAPFFHEGALDEVGTGELIGEGAGAIGAGLRGGSR